MDKERRIALVREAGEWLDRLKDADSTTLVAFEAWLAADPEHFKITRQLLTLRAALRISVAEHPHIRALHQSSPVVTLAPRLAAPCDLKLIDADKNAPPTENRWRRRVPGTLAVLVFVAIGALLLLTPSPKLIYETERFPALFTLKDGTQLHLNAHTEVAVRMSSHAREVALDHGEAKFDVAHDSSRPFRVAAHGTIAQALGTSFDVKLHEGGDVSVLVEQGHVAVSLDAPYRALQRSVELHGSQAARVRAVGDDRSPVLEVLELAPQSVRRALAWASRIEFHGETLREAVEQLNAGGGVRLVVDDEEAAKVRIGGSFGASDAAGFAQAVARFGGLEVSGPDAAGVIHVSSAERRAVDER